MKRGVIDKVLLVMEIRLVFIFKEEQIEILKIQTHIILTKDLMIKLIQVWGSIPQGN